MKSDSISDVAGADVDVCQQKSKCKCIEDLEDIHMKEAKAQC